MVESVPVFSGLFRGISQEEGISLMNEMGAMTRRIPAGTIVLREGTPKRNIGILLDGCLSMYETDSEGRRSMIGYIHPPESFALIFSFAAVERHPATVVAVEDSQILVIPIARILPPSGSGISDVRRRFVHNVMCEICELAWRLRARAFILAQRSTPLRLMTYLRMKMRAEGSREFDIPFDRQGLADFLCVDRSALSSVLGRLAKKGVLSYRKNHIAIHAPFADFD